MQRSAFISDCGRYRYRLERRWGVQPLLQFVMLNPSTADANIDDPTIRRCMNFARREGCGGIVVVNRFALRATSPKQLWEVEDPDGPLNNEALREVARDSNLSGRPIVCAWGTYRAPWNVDEVVYLMRSFGATFVCLGHTKDGNPRHPLYVKSDQPLVGLYG